MMMTTTTATNYSQSNDQDGVPATNTITNHNNNNNTLPAATSSSSSLAFTHSMINKNKKHPSHLVNTSIAPITMFQKMKGQTNADLIEQVRK
jgi:hypothetical protein